MINDKKTYQTRQFMLSNNYEIFHYKDDYLKEIALHHHDFYEIYMFISGQVTYDIEGKTYKLCSGDLLLISPDELHQPIVNSGNYERIVLWINKNFVKEVSTEKNDLMKCFKLMKKDNKNLMRLEPNQSQKIRNLLEDISLSFVEKKFAYEIYASSLVKILLIELARIIETCPDSLVMYHTASKLIHSVIEYIDKNLQKQLTLEGIAKEFFISKFYLSHIFKKTMGTTVYRYITQKRLILAKEFIVKGHMIKTVYLDCGYQDYSSFFRMFKKEYGITPKEYLKYMTKQNEVITK
ncbi:MAG: AraC family transcriptional regulator [Bacillota bacterium]